MNEVVVTPIQRRAIIERLRVHEHDYRNNLHVSKCAVCGEHLLDWKTSEPFNTSYTQAEKLLVEHIVAQHPEILSWYGMNHDRFPSDD